MAVCRGQTAADEVRPSPVGRRCTRENSRWIQSTCAPSPPNHGYSVGHVLTFQFPTLGLVVTSSPPLERSLSLAESRPRNNRKYGQDAAAARLSGARVRRQLGPLPVTALQPHRRKIAQPSTPTALDPY
ncbi:hypothetical protein C8Q79DRAFT_128503 [Trametes meyenii]|nr:hypothetical protein C8Q79DRAFT_128503 [Trametes meyenii]